MHIFDIIFLIIGIFLILGNSLIISHYKQKYPEEEFDYTYSLVIIFFGVLLIVGVITGLIGVLVLSAFVINLILAGYYVRRPEVYHKVYPEYQDVYKGSKFSVILRISSDMMWVFSLGIPILIFSSFISESITGGTLTVGIAFIIGSLGLLGSKYKSENKEHARKLKFYGLFGLLIGIILIFSTIILDYIYWILPFELP